MPILSGDVKILESDTMTDAPEGGGAVTNNEVVDGQSNNIFDDISTLDRVYGAVNLRKIFAAVTTQTTDKFYGSHLIISKLPGDGKIGVNLFDSGDWFDRRPAAASRIENYLAQGGRYNGFLWATQYQGSRAVLIFQSESAPVPGVGDVLMLVSPTDEQYIRITRIDQSVQEFTDNSGTFTRLILTLEISEPLTADFVGAQISRYDTIDPEADIYDTVVANAARYYSARPLAIDGTTGDQTIKVDSVFSQVVPASQSEVAQVDVSAGGNAMPVVESNNGQHSITISADFGPNIAIYLGSPCLPGTLSIPIGGQTLTDDSGSLKIGGVTVGTISYPDGVMTFAATSPTYGGDKTATFTPAAAPIRLADTYSIAVTAANRGYVWTINIVPPPKPGALRISYRALNKWYELHDNGGGGIIAGQQGIGSGTVNYVTGSVSVTFGALPDADSEIIFAWGNEADFANRANIAPPPMTVKHMLTNDGVDPSTLTIAWNDGQARTLTSDAAGVLTGDGSGTLNAGSGELEFSPDPLPLGGTEFTVSYSYGAKTSKTISSFNTNGNTVDFLLGDTNIVPGSLEIDWQTAWTADQTSISEYALPEKSGTVNKMAVDDGAGALRGIAGSIVDYANGSVTLDPTTTKNYRVLTGYYNLGRWYFSGDSDQSVPTQVPGSFGVKYRTAAAGQSTNEVVALNQVKLDLTPGYNETVVGGSLLLNFGGRSYVDRSGSLYYDIDPETGAGTYAGNINYTTGDVTLNNWAAGAANNVALKSLLTTMNWDPVDGAVFRVPVAPVKTQSFSVRAVPADGGGQISATSAADGTIDTADMQGFIEYETGVVRIDFGAWVAAAGNENEWWYDPTGVENGQIFKPRHVFADTIYFNAVSYSYLPLSSDILGLNPVRLPADGRVPIYAPGDVIVVLSDQTTIGTYSSSAITNLGRVRLAKVAVKDSAGNDIADTAYTVDLDAGEITWGDLTGISQPLTITDRIEDMAVVTDVQITGELALSQPITHDYTAADTLVANAVIYGDKYARTSIPFDQQTWTNEWSDELIGSDTVAQYNNSQYPIVVDNASAIEEHWVVIFTSATDYTVTGEHVGQIAAGNTSLDCEPINPNTGQPYFSIPASGWGSGWSAGNVLRFNTYAANAPTWIIQAISQGEATDTDYTFCIEARGDIDAN